MPWFRQSSFGMSLARLRLPKQHTIATSDEAAAPKKDNEKEPEILKEIIVSVCFPFTLILLYNIFIHILSLTREFGVDVNARSER